MMKCLLMITIIMFVSLFLVSCTPDTKNPVPDSPSVEDPGESDGSTNLPVAGDSIKISVGSVSFTATLSGNQAAKAFKGMLPMTVNMGELNGNEKYYYLPESLPASASRPESVRNGDMMLFGSDCLVLFYKTFTTSYSYTRVGTINNPAALESVLGKGNVTVKFEIFGSL